MNIFKKHIGNVLLIFSLAPALVIAAGGFPSSSIASARDKSVSQESMITLSKLSQALDEIANIARPAVVNISTTSMVTTEDNPFGDMFNDPFFRHFFGDKDGHPGQRRKHKSSALGSGVIVSEHGYILTNNHVVQGAEEIKVTLYDKREFKGKIVGTDPRTDLAVIKIAAKDLPTLRLGESGKLKIGDIVLAVEYRARGFRGFHPDRCGHQSRQFRRSAGEQQRRTCGDQHRYLLDQRRVHGNRFCHSFGHGKNSHGQHHRSRESDPRLARREHPESYP
jgi:S1-C subfamily serine protease